MAGYGPDTITDFADGEDTIVLDGGISFEQLTITSVDGQTQIALGSEILAELVGIDAGVISSDDFSTSVF